jgi:hypothetical protein
MRQGFGSTWRLVAGRRRRDGGQYVHPRLRAARPHRFFPSSAWTGAIRECFYLLAADLNHGGISQRAQMALFSLGKFGSADPLYGEYRAYTSCCSRTAESAEMEARAWTRSQSKSDLFLSGRPSRVLSDFSFSDAQGEFVTCAALGSGKTPCCGSLTRRLPPMALGRERCWSAECRCHCGTAGQSEKLCFVMQSPEHQIFTDKVCTSGIRASSWDTKPHRSARGWRDRHLLRD